MLQVGDLVAASGVRRQCWKHGQDRSVRWFFCNGWSEQNRYLVLRLFDQAVPSKCLGVAHLGLPVPFQDDVILENFILEESYGLRASVIFFEARLA